MDISVIENAKKLYIVSITGKIYEQWHCRGQRFDPAILHKQDKGNGTAVSLLFGKRHCGVLIAVSLLFGKRHGRVLNFDRDLYLNSIAVSLNSIALHTAKTNFPVKSKQSTHNQHATCGKVN